MIRWLFIGFFFFTFWTSHGQIFEPVSWSVDWERMGDDHYRIILKADMESGWAVYSQFLERDDGPIATAINFEKGDHFDVIGKAKEFSDHKKSGYDPIFEMNLTKYFESFTIEQEILWVDTSVPIVGYVSFMTCDDQRCLPPAEEPFSISTNDPLNPAPTFLDTGYVEGINQRLYGMENIQKPVAVPCIQGIQPVDQRQGLFTIFVLGLLGGVLALLTPCVFPLIPLTVSFFSKRNQRKASGIRDALLYGFFIVLVYVLISVPFHLLDSVNPDILNDISTNVWLNLFFFVVFLVFAFSFFGFYELTLPSGLTNRVSAAEGVGGVLGIFFMALTLSLVSFSCTGPILGSLLAGTLTGGAWQLTAGISGFGLALALPFALFALFPGWLAKLPKSGGWMNQMKIVLGFVELALALKFLSNADLVMGWGFLKYELFVGHWLIIALLLALYAVGLLRFKSDGPRKLNGWSAAFGILMLGFAVYLGTGLTKNPDYSTYRSLKLLSGLAPPASYSWAYPNDCPLGIDCYKDFSEGVAVAMKTGKPILLDFTGYACVNCREMEENVWSQPEVFQHLSQDYVLISLYVDAKQPLPKEEQVTVEKVGGGTRTLRNVGHKWAHFQTRFFQTNAQPFYVLLAPDGQQMLSEPIGYTPDAATYIKFLACGLDRQADL